MKADVAIIGGGMSGLATGALLGKAGKRVVVLERGNQVGGRAYTYEEKGFTLNYGPHALYRPTTGPYGEIVRRLELPAPEYGRPDPMRSFWSDRDRFASLGSRAHQAMTTKLFSIGSRIEFAKLMLALRGEKPERLGDMTWGEWLSSKTNDDAVRRFALALACVNTYGHPSADLSARWLISHFQRNLWAKDYVGYMSGGWRSMYDAFVSAIEASGGAVVTGARVDVLEQDGDGRIVAAATSQRRYEADAFVSTLPPQQAPALAGAGSPLAAELGQWATLVDVRAHCIDLGFSRSLRDDLTFVFDVERDLYYSLHSEVTPDLAPTGGQLMHAMAYLSTEDAADDSRIRRRHEELVAGLDRFFPGWREAVVVERTLHDAQISAARRTPEQLKRLVPLRSSVAENLYFATDARDIPYNLSEVVFAAALEVADAIASRAPAAGTRAGVA